MRIEDGLGICYASPSPKELWQGTGMDQQAVYTPRKIERFGERVMWMAQHLPFRREFTKGIDNRRDIYRALEKISVPIKEESTFYKYLKAETAVPYTVLQGLITLFPNMALEVLISERYETFLESVTTITEAVERWKRASVLVASERETFEHLAKDYYREVDADPDFPLVTGPGWLPEAAVRLSENDPMTPIDKAIPDVQGLPLLEDFGTYDFIKQLMMAEPWRLTNDLTFRVKDIQPQNGSVAFAYSPGTYFNYINTCEVLGAELADAWSSDRALSPETLPLRGDPRRIFDFRWRSAFPGVNCLLFLKNFAKPDQTGRGTPHRFAMHSRGQATLEAQNTEHVVPAGGHQPTSAGMDSDIEQLIWRTAVREFVEELFDKEEAQAIRDLGQEFLEADQVRPFVNHIFRKDGVAALFFLGVGFDPLTTKPEILVAIVIDWARVMKDPRTWDVVLDRDQRSKGLKILGNYEGKIRYCELTEENLEQEAVHSFRGHPVLPAGKACLLRAKKFFPELMASV